MAKKSMVEREKKRQVLVDRFAKKRAALKVIINDQSKPGRAFPRLSQACCTAAQQLGHAAAQPVPAYGPSARVLPQTQSVPDHAARARLERAAARRREIELVRRSEI